MSGGQPKKTSEPTETPAPLPQRPPREREDPETQESSDEDVKDVTESSSSDEEQESEASNESNITEEEESIDDVVDFRMIVYLEEILVVSPKILEGPNLGLLAALIDTGATASLITEHVFRNLLFDQLQREDS